MIDVLRRTRGEQAKELGLGQIRNGYLVVDRPGRPIRPEAHSDERDELCHLAGVQDYTLHEARHTSVTLMRERGVSDMDVAQWHGHDEVTMKRTYSHSSEEALRKAGEVLLGVAGAS